jgi:hypothetical protein
MAVLPGQAGSVKIATVLVAELDTWSLSFGPNLAETASFGDSWEEKTKTIMRFSGSASGRFDDTDTNGALILNTAALTGIVAALRLYVDDTNYWSGNAFIEMNPSASVSGMVDLSFTFTGTGALTWT